MRHGEQTEGVFGVVDVLGFFLEDFARGLFVGDELDCVGHDLDYHVSKSPLSTFKI